MKEVKLEYAVIIGRDCASTWMPWSVDLTDAEMAIYQNAVDKGIPLNGIRELYPAIGRAYDDISEYEGECAEDYDDEFDADNREIRVKFIDPNYS